MRLVSLVLGLLLLGLGGCTGLTPTQTEEIPPPSLVPPWQWAGLPSGDLAHPVWALQRPALRGHALYRVLILPGSGCTAWHTVASRFTSGLEHADVTLLHKPGVDLNAPRVQMPCPDDWVQRESLALWRDQARLAVAALGRMWAVQGPLPTVLVGVSEGAELLPAVQSELPGPIALVLVGSSGLDPRDQGALQMAVHGAGSEWAVLSAAIQSQRDDHELVHGRTLRYWRDFWHWSLMKPLLDSPWPLLRARGNADASVPQAAYTAWRNTAKGRTVPWCDLVILRGDHGLQRPDLDGMQQVWQRLERWAHAGADVEVLCPASETVVD